MLYKNNEKNSDPKSSLTTEHNEYITKLLDNDPQIFADDTINSLTEPFEGFTILFLSSMDVALCSFYFLNTHGHYNTREGDLCALLGAIQQGSC